MLRSLLVTLATTALVAVPSLAHTAPAQRAGDPTFHMQPVGSCHALTHKQLPAESAPARAVPCTSKHTTQTIASFRLTGKIDWKDMKALSRTASKRCHVALKTSLGTNAKSRAMSAYSFAWFVPSAAERRRGAKWLRCDLVLFGGKQLRSLPTDGSPFLTVPLTDSVTRCETARYVTVCAKAHAFRALGAVRLKGTRYPGDRRIRRVALRRCPSITGTREWRWHAPGAATWRHDDRVLVCLAKTSG